MSFLKIIGLITLCNPLNSLCARLSQMQLPSKERVAVNSPDTVFCGLLRTPHELHLNSHYNIVTFSKCPTLEPEAHENRQLQITTSLSITEDEWFWRCEGHVHPFTATHIVLASPPY